MKNLTTYFIQIQFFPFSYLISLEFNNYFVIISHSFVAPSLLNNPLRIPKKSYRNARVVRINFIKLYQLSYKYEMDFMPFIHKKKKNSPINIIYLPLVIFSSKSINNSSKGEDITIVPHIYK